jgi:hypothetical protein
MQAVRRRLVFHRDAATSGGKRGLALASGISLALGGSIGALLAWFAGVSWLLAALVALGCLCFFYMEGAYRVWDKADHRTQEAMSALTEAREKPTSPVHAPTFIRNQGTISESSVTNTYNAGERAPFAGDLLSLQSGTGISKSLVNIEYGEGPLPALPESLPSTQDERTNLSDQLMALADQVESVMAPWGQRRGAVAVLLGIPADEFILRMPEILAQRSRIDDEATARYNSECRSAVIQAYGHVRSIGFTDAEMERLWRTDLGVGASHIPERLRIIAAWMRA